MTSLLHSSRSNYAETTPLADCVLELRELENMSWHDHDQDVSTKVKNMLLINRCRESLGEDHEWKIRSCRHHKESKCKFGEDCVYAHIPTWFVTEPSKKTAVLKVHADGNKKKRSVVITRTRKNLNIKLNPIRQTINVWQERAEESERTLIILETENKILIEENELLREELETSRFDIRDLRREAERRSESQAERCYLRPAGQSTYVDQDIFENRYEDRQPRRVIRQKRFRDSGRVSRPKNRRRTRYEYVE